MEVRDPAGKVVFNMAAVDIFTFGIDRQPTWDPGEVLSTTLTWPPQCPPGPTPASCPPGTYSVVVRFGSYVSAPSPITLT